jgi:hypothetical protein
LDNRKFKGKTKDTNKHTNKKLPDPRLGFEQGLPRSLRKNQQAPRKGQQAPEGPEWSVGSQKGQQVQKGQQAQKPDKEAKAEAQ